MTALLEKGFAVTRAAAAGAPARADRSSLLVLGQFTGGKPPQAEDAAGEVSIRFQDITGFDAARIAESVESARALTSAVKQGDWKPWFPVIDYDRCTNCMQCLSFCLFGVYGVDAGQKFRCRTTTTARPTAPPARASVPKPRSCFRNTRPARSTATW